MAHFGRALEYGAPVSRTPTSGSFEPFKCTWSTRAGTYYYDGGKFIYEYVKRDTRLLHGTILVWLALFTPQAVYSYQPKLRARVSITGKQGRLQNSDHEILRISADLEPENHIQDPLAYKSMALAVFSIMRNHVAVGISHSISFGNGWADEVRAIPKTVLQEAAALETYDTIGDWVDRENVRNGDRHGIDGMGTTFDDERPRGRNKSMAARGHDKENTPPPYRDPLRDLTREFGNLR